MKRKYVGFTTGVINEQVFESETQMDFLDTGELVGKILVKKLPKGFHLGYLSLSNSSQKIGTGARMISGKISIADYLKRNGSIISSRIYTYPDFPDASFCQIGKAELTEDGISYKNILNGYSGSLPIDIIAINPYIQKITKKIVGGLALQADTTIISESLGEIKTQIIGTYTFLGDIDFPNDYEIKHSPIFKIIGENHFKSGGFENGLMEIDMNQFVIENAQVIL
jgi:hypothetical protein